VTALRNSGHRRQATTSGAPAARAPLVPGPSKATDVHTLLANFTAGVHRGLAEARQGRSPAEDPGAVDTARPAAGS
jgi:hypothetical protein